MGVDRTKKMNKKGFSLIELIVYLSIFSSFVLLSFTSLATFFKDFFKEFESNKKFIRNSIILDLLKRDLICSSPKITYWDKNNFVFRKKYPNKNYLDISWQMRKDGVYRLIGKYDYLQNKWFKKNVAKLSFTNCSFSFFLKKDLTKNFVKNIKILFDDKEIFINYRNAILK
ncbi:hypothetical protein GF385_04560 [Candidatus Dependentiae bacterium]|nr:hypothetical protein [Candidatus Dependentiae bacterium]